MGLLCVLPTRGATGARVLTETFDTPEDFAAWTCVDLNGGRSWEYLNGRACYMLDYQTGLPGDDWLISPPFTLERGRVYDLDIYVGSLTRPESLRIMLGTAASPENMTTVIADYPALTSDMNGMKKLRIAPSVTGTYHLGLYAYSQANLHRLEVDDIALTDVGHTLAPGAITDLVLEPGAQGSMTARLAFTLPATTAGGAILEDISEIMIFRNGEPVGSLPGGNPGETRSWEDPDVILNGINTYEVTAHNSFGHIDLISASAFIGHDTPHPVSTLRAAVEADRSVNVTWKAPAASMEGGYVDFDALLYKVVRSDGVTVADALAATSVNDPRPVASGQAEVSYAVTVKSAVGRESETLTSNSVTVGNPLQLPYMESFAGMKMQVPWSQDPAAADFEWEMTFDDEDGEVEEVSSHDLDNGMLRALNRNAGYGEQSRLVSPMLDLSSVVSPCLTFWFYQARSPWYDPDMDGEINDRLQVQYALDGGDWQNLDDALFYINESDNGWQKYEIPLPRVESGHYVNIGFLAIAESDARAWRSIYIDEIAIDESPYAHDLAITSFTTDFKRADINQTTRFTVGVSNRGTDVEGDYQVLFFRDDEIVETVEGSPIPAAGTTTFTHEFTPGVNDAEQVSIAYRAEIKYEADENRANNQSETLLYSVRPSDLPAVSDLSGTFDGTRVELVWSALTDVTPAPQGAPVTVTDGFESYEPFIIEGIGAWTMYDADGATTLNTPRILADYPHRGEPMAFQVFNPKDAGVWVEDYQDNAFEAHGGAQYLICMSTNYPAENDDWLISPRLDGRAHTVSFYAKSASYDYEWIRTYVSSTDNHTDSFMQLSEGDHIGVADSWQKYEFTVPVGTRYFAIRCVRRCVLLEIDDFTYDAWDGEPQAAALIGYNVYRDGERLNQQPLTSTSFIDKEATVSHSYRVTGVYDRGESMYSAPYELVPLGVESVGQASPVSVRNNVIHLSCISNYTICSTDGRVIAAGESLGNVSHFVQPGIYIVHTGDCTVKVVVR